MSLLANAVPNVCDFPSIINFISLARSCHIVSTMKTTFLLMKTSVVLVLLMVVSIAVAPPSESGQGDLKGIDHGDLKVTPSGDLKGIGHGDLKAPPSSDLKEICHGGAAHPGRSGAAATAEAVETQFVLHIKIENMLTSNSTHSRGSTATSEGLTATDIKVNEQCLGDISSQYRSGKTLVDVKGDTNSNVKWLLLCTNVVSIKLTVDELFAGAKTKLSFKLHDQKSGKVNSYK
ncbi:hypothetical protein ZIOFF_025848 [Zingiber officinale]|uniref:Uncharacterized protein n=1 Tax=Zingiber officinale TaxID=94328 RepID=A0A8J5H2H6_ZINOF|nr:hypothetical protein ZIOFF_025848 [Zingiber officinale]